MAGAPQNGSDERIIYAQMADAVNRRTVYIVLIFVFIAGHAGGLGIAPLLAVAGVVGMLSLDFRLTKGRFSRILQTEWVIALALFMAWVSLSALWSPYQSRGLPNAFKLSVGIILYEAGRRAFVRAAGPSRVFPQNALQSLMIYLPLIAAVLLCLDLISGFGLTNAVDAPSAGEDLEKKRGDAVMNTANGIVLLSLMAAPSLIIMLWTRHRGPIFSILLLSLIVACALINGLNAALIALVASIVAMMAAAFYPRATIGILTGLSMALVGFAPLLAGLAALTSPSFRAALPFSWEHRLVNWSHIGERIREHPIVGHGFDAARTFDATFNARGFSDLAVVSLHPHNAGLHIWVETGFIGAVLACVTLFLIGKRAQNFALGGRARAMALAGFIAPAVLFASVSYGVWQDWWWATLFVCAGVLYFVPRTKGI